MENYVRYLTKYFSKLIKLLKISQEPLIKVKSPSKTAYTVSIILNPTFCFNTFFNLLTTTVSFLSGSL